MCHHRGPIQAASIISIGGEKQLHRGKRNASIVHEMGNSSYVTCIYRYVTGDLFHFDDWQRDLMTRIVTD
jgi:hypothetical protein